MPWIFVDACGLWFAGVVICYSVSVLGVVCLGVVVHVFIVGVISVWVRCSLVWVVRSWLLVVFCCALCRGVILRCSCACVAFLFVASFLLFSVVCWCRLLVLLARYCSWLLSSCVLFNGVVSVWELLFGVVGRSMTIVMSFIVY